MPRYVFLSVVLLLSPCLAVDIPKLDSITIDGEATDWKDAGFRIDCMGDTGEARHPSFDPKVRLAWDERGLLVLATVKDGTPKEAGDLERLYDGDSIELFVVEDSGKSSRMQILIAPGTTTDQPAVRWHVFDHRQNKPAETKAQVEAAREKIDGGYRLEVRVPWSNFSKPFKQGEECGVQVYANDLHHTRKSGGAWYPSDESNRDPSAVHRVKLSDRASAPQTIGTMLTLHRWRTANVSVRVGPDADLDVKFLELWNKDAPISLIRVNDKPISTDDRPVHRAAIAQRQPGKDQVWRTRIPLEQPSDEVKLILKVDGKEFLEMHKSGLKKRRTDGFYAQGMSGPFAFSGESFPNIDFVQPNLVEDLVGPYDIERTFYDSEFNEVPFAEKPGRYGAIVTVSLADGSKTRWKFTLYRMAREDAWADLKLSPLPAMPEAFDLPTEENAWLDEAIRNGLRTNNERFEGLAISLAGLGEHPQKIERYADDPFLRNDQWWLDLERKIGTYKQYPCVEVLPKGFAEGGEKKWPLILFLHGSGERGEDLEQIRKQDIVLYVQSHADDIPAIFIAPQCPRFERWSPPRVMDLLATLKSKYPIDESRIYLTGLSMGGFGSWLTATYSPETFACVAPLCGGGAPRFTGVMKDLPTWAFHGDADRVVPAVRSTEMIDALKGAGASPKLTIYPKGGHNIWTQTYNDPEFYKWMFGQQRK